jgi:hypothetical protein
MTASSIRYGSLDANSASQEPAPWLSCNGCHHVHGSPIRRPPVRTSTEYPIKLGRSSGRRDVPSLFPVTRLIFTDYKL